MQVGATQTGRGIFAAQTSQLGGRHFHGFGKAKDYLSPAKMSKEDSLSIIARSAGAIWKSPFLVPQPPLHFRVHSFRYHDGNLHCEGVALESVAEKYGTPLYVYSAGTILDHYHRLDSALGNIDHLICYAVKANSNRAILRLLADEGAGFDIVSGGELFRVLAAGGDAPKCNFAGVGKSPEEVQYG